MSDFIALICTFAYNLHMILQTHINIVLWISQATLTKLFISPVAYLTIDSSNINILVWSHERLHFYILHVTLSI